MRYTEPKERSAELLRLTLAHMGRHVAAFNPLTFALWYEYAAGINPRLSRDVDALTAASTPIDDATVSRLYQAHVAPADSQMLERIRDQMQSVMSGVARSATQTGSQAGEFGAQLDTLTAALGRNLGVEQLGPQLSVVMSSTAEMKSAVDALQLKVAHSQDEISRLRADLERARDEALLDPLTGILNRKGFDQRMVALAAPQASTDTSHCLVMMDIDHFKKVNDTHGHVVGDRVLQAVGQILRTSITAPGHTAARYGGEEFALLLPQVTLAQGAQVAEAVRARTRNMKLRNRSTQELLTTVTMSCGVAALKPGEDIASLLARADEALYRSKHAGRDRVTTA